MSPPRRSEDVIRENAQRLVDATFRVIASTGDADPSVRPILEEAGLARAAFYECFASKDDLMDAVLAEGRRILLDYLTRRMARAVTPEARVRAWVGGVMRQAEAASAAKRTRPFVLSPGERTGRDPGALLDTDRLLSAPLRDAIADGVAEGSFVSDDPARDALTIQDFVLQSQRRHLVLGTSPSRAATDALADFALRALRSA